ncbi:MAG: alkaline phosphatase family protein [Exilibacterium sp.]
MTRIVDTDNNRLVNQRPFDHVLIIMFENEYRGYVMENDYMRRLAAQGIELCNSFGVMHPSQTNYIASIAGELCGVSDDKQPSPLPQQTIVDLIEASAQNLRWKAYMDSYIAEDTPWCAHNFTPKDHFPYVIKHNPFSSFKNILNNQQRWNNIDNEAGFWRDLLNGELPEYAWFTPNMWNDGHYLAGSLNNDLKGERAPILVDQQARWLESFFAGLNFPGPDSKLPPRTLVVVTYDEADFEAFYDKGKKYTYDGPNQIYTVLLGDMIAPGQQHEGYNHYSLLKTIEKNFNLGDLGKNDRDANWFQFLWGRQFQWQVPQQTPLKPLRQLCSASYADRLYLIGSDDNGTLCFSTFDGTHWSQALPFAEDADRDPNPPLMSLSAAASETALLLAYRNNEKQLAVKHYDLNQGWCDIDVPVNANIGDVALVAVPYQSRFLLVYSDQQGSLYSLDYRNGAWQQTEKPICTHSEGRFSLVALGATILLIYKIGATAQLSCLSYNTAEFNKLDISQSEYAGPYDDTACNAWSGSAFPLHHFSETVNALTPGEKEPLACGFQASGTLAAATLDGVIHLLHNGPNNTQLLSETFSLSGTLTPVNPVSYNPAKNGTTSNGYGTLLEAGWSRPVCVSNVFRGSHTPLTVARLREQLWLFYQPLDTQTIYACSGFYRSL